MRAVVNPQKNMRMTTKWGGGGWNTGMYVETDYDTTSIFKVG